MKLACPICKRPVETQPSGEPRARFCSDRCRLVDLGNWLSDSYRIGSPISEEDLDESLPPAEDA